MTDRDSRKGFAEGAAGFTPRQADQPQEVQASVAKTHFSQLLDAVERGASFVVLRHGRPVAHLVPDPEHRARTVSDAIAAIKRIAEERARRFGTMTVEEILALRHEGHKY